MKKKVKNVGANIKKKMGKAIENKKEKKERKKQRKLLKQSTGQTLAIPSVDTQLFSFEPMGENSNRDNEGDSVGINDGSSS